MEKNRNHLNANTTITNTTTTTTMFVLLPEFIVNQIQAGAFRSLCQHLQERSDLVQNMELMTISGFCRNCLAKVSTSHSLLLYLYSLMLFVFYYCFICSFWKEKQTFYLFICFCLFVCIFWSCFLIRSIIIENKGVEICLCTAKCVKNRMIQ